MPRLTWPEFTELHRRAHLLIAVLPEEGPPGNVREHVNLMAKLLHRLAKGDYALTINRQRQFPEIHCAFERETDAETIGRGVVAELQIDDQRWLSRRWFNMDAAAFETIRDALDAVRP